MKKTKERTGKNLQEEPPRPEKDRGSRWIWWKSGSRSQVLWGTMPWAWSRSRWKKWKRATIWGMKYLFEMIGLYPAAGEDGVVVPDTMAAILLRRLGSRNRRRRSRQLRKIGQQRLRFRMRRA